MIANEAPFNLDEINAAWSKLLSRYVVAKLALEKEVTLLRAANEALTNSNEDLRARLHQIDQSVSVTQDNNLE